MKFRFSVILLISVVCFSCQNDEQKREAEKVKDLKKKELVFASISKSWNFNTEAINPTSQSMLATWPAWRDFTRELSQKPQSSIGAFKQKSKNLTLRVAALPTAIPSQFNIPEIKSRIAVLTTKINELNLFVNLNDIPDQKVTTIIGEINSALSSLQLQMDEIVRKSKIPKEEGESEMIRMLDTSRAIPSKPAKISAPIEQGQIIQQIR